MNALSSTEPTEPQERVIGEGLLTLLEGLKQDRTVLQFTLLGEDYERLSLVTGLRRGTSGIHLLLDCPPGFTETVQDYRGARIRVEFLGQDRVQYVFRSRISDLSGNDIWVEIPDFAERIQRRRYFRIAPPLGTRISFRHGEKPLEASIINVSEGGCLASIGDTSMEGGLLREGGEIKHLRLWCDSGRVKTDFRVSKALVQRLEKNLQTGRLNLAVHFVEVDPRDMNALREFIFRWQRDMLQGRRLGETE